MSQTSTDSQLPNASATVEKAIVAFAVDIVVWLAIWGALLAAGLSKGWFYGLPENPSGRILSIPFLLGLSTIGLVLALFYGLTNTKGSTTLSFDPDSLIVDSPSGLSGLRVSAVRAQSTMLGRFHPKLRYVMIYFEGGDTAPLACTPTSRSQSKLLKYLEKTIDPA